MDVFPGYGLSGAEIRSLADSQAIKRVHKLSGRKHTLSGGNTAYPEESQVIWRKNKPCASDYKPCGGITSRAAGLQAVRQDYKPCVRSNGVGVFLVCIGSGDRGGDLAH